MHDAAEADDIKTRILADPDVILEDREVMRALIAADRSEARNVVDLRGVLVERLESRLDQLEDAHRSVIAAAYENVAGAAQVHRAVLSLVEQPRFVDFLKVLTLDVPEMVAVDRVRLCIESEVEEAGPIFGLDPELKDRVVALPTGGVEAYLALGPELNPAGERDVALRPAPPEAAAIHGEDADWVRSEALVRLDLGAPDQHGLLVFAAADPDRFAPDHGVDLLTFFGGVVARAMRRWVGPGAT